jgi:hypothetical protein
MSWRIALDYLVAFVGLKDQRNIMYKINGLSITLMDSMDVLEDCHKTFSDILWVDTT